MLHYNEGDSYKAAVEPYINNYVWVRNSVFSVIGNTSGSVRSYISKFGVHIRANDTSFVIKVEHPAMKKALK